MSKTYTVFFVNGGFVASTKAASLRAIEVQVIRTLNCVRSATPVTGYDVHSLVIPSLGAVIRARLDDVSRPKSFPWSSDIAVRYSEVIDRVWDAIFSFHRDFSVEQRAFQVKLTFGDKCERLSKNFVKQFTGLDRDTVHNLGGKSGL